jgi:hypothetical protein
MENVLKKIKLIGGGLIATCCLFPFISVGISLGFFGGISTNIIGLSLLLRGFSFSAGLGFLFFLSMTLILGGAAALIYVGATKKDITLFSKFTLSFVGKLAAVTGGGLVFITVLSTPYFGMGFGLILELIVAVSLLFEDQIVGAIKKGSTPPTPPQEN